MSNPRAGNMNNKTKRIINPCFSVAWYLNERCNGRQDAKILPPSNGKIGSRLNTAKVNAR